MCWLKTYDDKNFFLVNGIGIYTERSQREWLCLCKMSGSERQSMLVSDKVVMESTWVEEFLAVCLSLYLPICVSVHLSVCLFVCLCMYCLSMTVHIHMCAIILFAIDFLFSHGTWKYIDVWVSISQHHALITGKSIPQANPVYSINPLILWILFSFPLGHLDHLEALAILLDCTLQWAVVHLVLRDLQQPGV